MGIGMSQRRKLKPKSLFAFPKPVVNQPLNLDLRDLLVLNLGLDQEDTRHSAFDHLDQNHNIQEISQKWMFSTDFQTLGMSV
jgi:hypothetical protein